MLQSIFGKLDDDTKNIIILSVVSAMVPAGLLSMIFLSDWIPSIFS